VQERAKRPNRQPLKQAALVAPAALTTAPSLYYPVGMVFNTAAVPSPDTVSAFGRQSAACIEPSAPAVAREYGIGSAVSMTMREPSAFMDPATSSCAMIGFPMSHPLDPPSGQLVVIRLPSRAPREP
jgi:hypothetical protein